MQLHLLRTSTIQDVADEVEQVRAGGIDGAGVVHLLRSQRRFGVLGKQPGKNQKAVERRAEPRATCWRGTRTCTSSSTPAARASRQGDLGGLDFAVLDLDVAVAQLEQACLLGEILVGLLQRHGSLLQLTGEQLGLGEQVLGALVDHDRVEDDA